ncbi:TPA: hypothetical protein MD252_005100 [Klebsiella pneumoniae]|nr:hypothetical protein [Klebsiella pneumoniae]
MTKSTITREQAQKIIVAADEVITALAGTNEDVHPDDSKKMCELWDDLNDRHAPPVVVRELARMALTAMDSEPEQWRDAVIVTPLYLHAQPAPVAPEMPDFKKLARELVDNLVDCGGLDEGVKEKYLEWAEKTCHAAMFAAAPQENN